MKNKKNKLIILFLLLLFVLILFYIINNYIEIQKFLYPNEKETMYSIQNNNGYVTCNVMGGLGNQLFQICTTMSYAKDTNRQFLFVKRSDYGNRNSYFESFFQTLEPYLITENDYELLFSNGKEVQYSEQGHQYNPIPEFPLDKNVVLNGYFQSEKYFKHNWQWIADTIWGSNIDYILQSIELPSFQNIGLHFRIGDYKNLHDFHPVLPVDYYIKALKETNSNTNQIYFLCEDSDMKEVEENISKIKQQFPNYEYKRIVINKQNINDKDKDWKEMIAFGLCDINIIANSTFSWWGAYLGKYIKSLKKMNNSVKIYYPSMWFGKSIEHKNNNDLFPEDWIRISV